MRIAIVSSFYSEGMGYTENCLPKALARRGHDVHVLTSEFNVYGTSSAYAETYEPFLGPAMQSVGKFRVDGYTVHRLRSKIVGGYVAMSGLLSKIRAMRPDVVHSLAVASLPTFQLAPFTRALGFRMFAESHQHLSVVRPYLTERNGNKLRKVAYRLTRTLPTAMASLAIDRCYAVAPDCLVVAREFYGVPERKLKLQPLGTDTDLFCPAESEERRAARQADRARLGFDQDDIVCIYTGRFSADKNPLLLARAIELLPESPRYRGVYIGGGEQAVEIARHPRSTILPFMKYADLAAYYALADIAVWPHQESMSMLDAAASGLPLIVSNQIGEAERAVGTGIMYQDGDIADMARALGRLGSADVRADLGRGGRKKMLDGYTWAGIAAALEADYARALAA